MNNISEDLLRDSQRYIEHVEGLIPIQNGDRESAAEIIRLLYIANKKINAAAAARTTHKFTDEDGHVVTAKSLRAMSYLYEGHARAAGFDEIRPAIKLMRSALSLGASRWAEANFMIGGLLARIGKKNEATSALHRAIQLAPDEFRYRMALDEIEGMSLARNNISFYTPKVWLGIRTLCSGALVLFTVLLWIALIPWRIVFWMMRL